MIHGKIREFLIFCMEPFALNTYYFVHLEITFIPTLYPSNIFTP